MVLIRLLLALLLAGALAAPSAAHKDHQKKMEAAAAAKAAEAAPAGSDLVAHPMSPAVHEAVKEDIAKLEAEAALPVHERLLDWLGRIHPFAVHFPIALFPIAWVALLLARRRGGEANDLLRSMIIIGGATATIAALLGWFNTGWSVADKDPLLAWHRWLGTGIGLAGAALAWWAWRRAASAGSRLMVSALALITLALLVQGWIGAALIHGIDHLNW